MQSVMRGHDQDDSKGERQPLLETADKEVTFRGAAEEHGVDIEMPLPSLYSSIHYHSAPSLQNDVIIATDALYANATSSHGYRRVCSNNLSGINSASIHHLMYDTTSRAAYRSQSDLSFAQTIPTNEHTPCLLTQATASQRRLLETAYSMDESHPTHQQCTARKLARERKAKALHVRRVQSEASNGSEIVDDAAASPDETGLLLWGQNCDNPSSSPLLEDGWRIDIEAISRKLVDTETKEFGLLSRNVRSFYNTQNELIQELLDAEEKFGTKRNRNMSKAIETMETRNGMATMLSNVVNVILTLAKLVLSYMTGSMSIVSSLVDSVVDLFTGLALWLASHHVSNHNPYKYPIGREQLEPIAVVVSAVVMVSASLQVIWESGKRLIGDDISIDLSLTAWIIMGLTISSKGVLYMYCRNIATPTGQALAQDHFNDVVSNTGAMLFAVLAERLWLPLDPIGAILIAIYIMYSWMKTGYEEIQGLSGIAAEPDTIKVLTYIAFNHHADIIAVETVSAYHFGTKMIAEVDIVLCPFTPLPIAHDIAETLQMKYESWGNIERAFVHIDFEIVHERSMEHQRHL
ncbi:hypothetical protein SARC_01812 [Sphaeroforma arctica JP610]|uniref:Cation efflux protein transmembrane domain-containing protein n=1 Tax=Sphaeroforma arctica JP610 TaxID=667725 RepID=A0A0L0GAT6_9EUKA|nr:hypothetical protein SARC_01812 [Sphaeroforma arctica JP610]KNC86011.1 hypothetical protein SARC_01812 [Sphaeroforma arctica JP610]|eukprot:XP_014159913.1 hypothetical protein SARC_01812 [Sphaeroforma arctica JP610]